MTPYEELKSNRNKYKHLAEQATKNRRPDLAKEMERKYQQCVIEIKKMFSKQD